MIRPTYRSRAVVIVLAAIGLGVSACTVNVESPTDRATHSTPAPGAGAATTPQPTPSADGYGSVNLPAVVEEYYDAARDLAGELPAGYIFPAEFPQSTSYDMAPEGTGLEAALYYWRCAWTDQFMTDFDSKDATAIDRDLDTLDTWTEFPQIRDSLGGDTSWHDDVVEPARDGDISTLRTLGYSGCKEVVKSDSGPPGVPAV